MIPSSVPKRATTTYEPVDLELIRLAADARPVAPRPAPRHQSRFLKGPVSLWWLEAAAKLPGKALHIAILLAYRAGMRGRQRLRLGRPDLDAFGVSRDAKIRALRVLAAADLIVVHDRGHGRSLEIDLPENALR